MTIKIIPNTDTLPVKLDSEGKLIKADNSEIDLTQQIDFPIKLNDEGKLVKSDGTLLNVSAQIDPEEIGLTNKADISSVYTKEETDAILGSISNPIGEVVITNSEMSDDYILLDNKLHDLNGYPELASKMPKNKGVLYNDNDLVNNSSLVNKSITSSCYDVEYKRMLGKAGDYYYAVFVSSYTVIVHYSTDIMQIYKNPPIVHTFDRNVFNSNFKGLTIKDSTLFIVMANTSSSKSNWVLKIELSSNPITSVIVLDNLLSIESQYFSYISLCYDETNDIFFVSFSTSSNSRIYTTNDFTTFTLSKEVTNIGVRSVSTVNGTTMFVGRNSNHQATIKTTDGGDTYGDVVIFSDNGDFYADIQLRNNDPNTVMTIGSAGMLYSTDGGSNWTKKPSNDFGNGYTDQIHYDHQNDRFYYLPTYTDKLYYASGSDLSSWTQKNWSNFDGGVKPNYMAYCVVDSAVYTTISGSSSLVIWKIDVTDNANVLSKIRQTYLATNPRKIFNLSDKKIMVIADNLLVSTDNFVTYENKTNHNYFEDAANYSNGTYISQVDMDPTGQYILMSVGKVLMYSTDGGTSWSEKSALSSTIKDIIFVNDHFCILYDSNTLLVLNKTNLGGSGDEYDLPSAANNLHIVYNGDTSKYRLIYRIDSNSFKVYDCTTLYDASTYTPIRSGSFIRGYTLNYIDPKYYVSYKTNTNNYSLYFYNTATDVVTHKDFYYIVNSSLLIKEDKAYFIARPTKDMDYYQIVFDITEEKVISMHKIETSYVNRIIYYIAGIVQGVKDNEVIFYNYRNQLLYSINPNDDKRILSAVSESVPSYVRSK